MPTGLGSRLVEVAGWVVKESGVPLSQWQMDGRPAAAEGRCANKVFFERHIDCICDRIEVPDRLGQYLLPHRSTVAHQRVF